MELTQGFRASPGCCAVCGNADSSKPCIDVGVEDRTQTGVQRIQRVYLCLSCAMEVGRLAAPAVGMEIVEVEKVTKLRHHSADLTNQLKVVTARMERAEGLLAQLREAVPS